MSAKFVKVMRDRYAEYVNVDYISCFQIRDTDRSVVIYCFYETLGNEPGYRCGVIGEFNNLKDAELRLNSVLASIESDHTTIAHRS